MYITITTADRKFSVGPGCPVDHRHLESPQVRAGAIIADARTESEAGSVSIDLERIGGVESLFWPAPVGASVSAFDSDTDELIVSGVLQKIEINASGIDLEVQL